MDEEDLELFQRLQKLKQTTHKIPTDSEIQQRLNKLKNIQSTSDNRNNFDKKILLEDKRSDNEKIEELIMKIKDEVNLLNNSIHAIDKSCNCSFKSENSDSDTIDLTSDSEIDEQEAISKIIKYVDKETQLEKRC